jgi:hypothetical protein
MEIRDDVGGLSSPPMIKFSERAGERAQVQAGRFGSSMISTAMTQRLKKL